MLIADGAIVLEPDTNGGEADEMSDLVEFLFPAPAPRRPGAILAWWERRRLPYNLAVGAAGVVSLLTVTLLSWLPPAAPQLGLPPWQPVVAFGVLANVCYLLGPAVEITVEKLWGRQILPTGPSLYRMGLTFSVGLALLPALVMIIMWVARIVFRVL